MKIKKNLFLVSGEAFGSLGNTAIIKYENGYIMIDSGKFTSLDIIRKNLQYWNINENDIKYILLTHGHDDHSGSANYFQQLGAKVYIGIEDQFMLSSGNLGKDSPFKNHILPKYSPDFLFDTDTTLKIGSLVINVIKVPGHTDGSVIYYLLLDEDLVMFTGDMFYPNGEAGLNPQTGWKGDIAYDSSKLKKSFAKLWKLSIKPTIIIGGHGSPLLGPNAKDMIMLAYKYFLVNDR